MIFLLAISRHFLDLNLKITNENLKKVCPCRTVNFDACSKMASTNVDDVDQKTQPPRGQSQYMQPKILPLGPIMYVQINVMQSEVIIKPFLNFYGMFFIFTPREWSIFFSKNNTFPQSFFQIYDKKFLETVIFCTRIFSYCSQSKDPAQNQWESAFRQIVWNFGIRWI